MRSTFRSLLLLFTLLPLAACGDDPEPMRAAGEAEADTATSPYGARAAENLRVVRVEAEVEDLPEGWDGIRIAALSDFNLGLWEDNEEVAAAAVRRAVELNPDLVVLLGDYVERADQVDALARVLAPLRGRTAMAVLGDRDKRDPELDAEGVDSTALRVVQTLQAAGIAVLRNERGRFARGGDTAYVAGIEPYVPRRPAWRQAEIFAAMPQTGTTPLLLSHMPAGVFAAPGGAYPLVLAGDTFCGQVEVPGAARLSWLNANLFPDPAMRVGGEERLYRVNGNGLFITCGVGYSFVPVRLGAPPEVALVTLRRPGAAEAGEPADTVPEASMDSLVEQFQRQDTTGAEGT